MTDIEGMIIPSDGEMSVSSIVPAIVMRKSTSLVSEAVLASESIVLFVVDGLGWHQIDRHRGELPCLGEALGTPITTVALRTMCKMPCLPQALLLVWV